MRSPADVPRSEYPRPQLVRPQWLCLNGPWSFGEDAAGSGEARGLPAKGRLAGRITVPFCPESALSGIGKRDFMPCVWYARKFTLPGSWKGKRLLVHFGAVDYEATVWLNGQAVGFHRGGYTPFACEITHAARGGANLLVVRAVDDTRSGLQASGKQAIGYHSTGCLYTRTTGIWQSVWAEPVGRAFIKSLRMIGDPAGGTLHLQVVIDSPVPSLALAVEVRAGRTVVGRASVDASTGLAAAAVQLDHVRLWDLDDPFLYDIRLTLADQKGVVDCADSYFGLRSITLEAPAILLNGRAVFQRLVLDQGYYPAGVYTAPRDADLKRDVVLAKRLGFNGARLHQKVFEPRFLYWADRLGYMVWGEYPNWGMDRSNGEAVRRMMAEWAEAVARDFNHPSIVGWCPFNEAGDWADGQMLRDVYRLTKALDPTRPVIDSSGWQHYETDVYDCHSYEQDPRKFAALFADFAAGGEPLYNKPGMAPYAGQPFFVSEYGGTGWAAGRRGPAAFGAAAGQAPWGYGRRPGSVKEFIERYRRLTTALLKHPRMCGLCYTQLYDIEQEINGLMTYGRKMKFDPETIAAINSQPAAIEKRRG